MGDPARFLGDIDAAARMGRDAAVSLLEDVVARVGSESDAGSRFVLGQASFLLARDYGLRDRYPEAIRAFHDALALPSLGASYRAGAHFGKGMAQLGLGEWVHEAGDMQVAESLLRSAREDFISSIGVEDAANSRMRLGYTLLRLAGYHAARGEGRETGECVSHALPHLDRSLEIDPDLALGYNFRGFALVKLQEYAQAREALRAAVARNGTGFAPAYVHLGDALRGMGERAAACYSHVTRLALADEAAGTLSRLTVTSAIKAEWGLEALGERPSTRFGERVRDGGVAGVRMSPGQLEFMRTGFSYRLQPVGRPHG